MGRFAGLRRSGALCALLLAFAVLGTLSCASSGGQRELTTVVPRSGVVTMTAGSSKTTARDVVLRSQEEVEELYRELGIRKMPQIVDFSERVVVATMRGCKPNSCYSAEIVEFFRRGGGGVVAVANASPDPSCICTAVMTCPFHIAAVPRVEGEYTFEHRPVSAECRKRFRSYP